MRKGYRIVYRDECGSESHVGEYATRGQASDGLKKAKRRLECAEGQRLWIESFDHDAPYYDESTGRMVYPDQDY